MPVLTDGTNRTARRSMRLGPHRIPAGTMVWVPFGATFASPHCWERADEYLPVRRRLAAVRAPAAGLPTCSCKRRSAAQERWDDADAEYARPLSTGAPVQPGPEGGEAQAAHAKRFLPFSLGARDCVGQSLARMNFTATVAMLLSEFSFRLADEVSEGFTCRSSLLWHSKSCEPALPCADSRRGRRADGRPGARA